MQAMHTFVGGGVAPRLMVLLLALAGDAAGAAALARAHRSGVEQKRSKMKQEPSGGDAARAASRDRGTADPPSSADGQVRGNAQPASARPGAAARAEPAAAAGEGRDAARQAMHGSGDGEPGSAGGSGSLSQQGSPSPVQSAPAGPALDPYARPSMARARAALVARCAELLAAPVHPAAGLAVCAQAWRAAQSCNRVCGAFAGLLNRRPRMSKRRNGSMAWLFRQMPWRCSLAALIPPAPCAALCSKGTCAAYMREQQLLEGHVRHVITKVSVLAGHGAAGG